MALGDIITFHDGTSWLNRVEGSDETFGRHDDKTAAATAGMARASVAHVQHTVEHESEREPESSGSANG